MIKKAFTTICFMCTLFGSAQLSEWQFSAYYAPQSGKTYNAVEVLEGTSKRPFFLGGKHGVSAAYYFNRSYFGFETGIARSRTGGNVALEYDNGAGGGTYFGALYNQQFIYTKIPFLLTLNKGKNNILGFTMKIGFEYGRLAYAQNYYWKTGALAFGYNQYTADDVAISVFSRVEDDKLRDYIEVINGISNHDLKSLYNKNMWSFLLEMGARYSINDQIDIHATAFIDAGFTNIQNDKALVDGKYFWLEENGLGGFGQDFTARTYSTIANIGLKFGLVYRLYDIYKAHGIKPRLPEE